MTKPCAREDLIHTLKAALEQYRLITGEKKLLEGTLTGTVRVLMEVLGLTNVEAIGRAGRIKRFVRNVAVHMGEMDVWLYENAVMYINLGMLRRQALLKMADKKERERYDPQVYRAFVEILQAEEQYHVRDMELNELLPFVFRLGSPRNR